MSSLVEVLVLDVDEALGEMNRAQIRLEYALLAFRGRRIEVLGEHRVERAHHLHRRDELVRIVGLRNGLERGRRHRQLVFRRRQIPVVVEQLLHVPDRRAAHSDAYVVNGSFLRVPSPPQIVDRVLEGIVVVLLQRRAQQQRLAVAIDDELRVRELVGAHVELFHRHCRAARLRTGVLEPLDDLRFARRLRLGVEGAKGYRRKLKEEHDAGDDRNEAAKQHERRSAKDGRSDDGESVLVERRLRQLNAHLGAVAIRVENRPLDPKVLFGEIALVGDARRIDRVELQHDSAGPPAGAPWWCPGRRERCRTRSTVA